MKQFKSIIVLILLVTSKMYAQDTIKLSLSQAYELGMNNRFDAQANKLNVDLANNAVEKNRKEWIPEVTASGDVIYNTKLQTTKFPNATGDGFDDVSFGTKNQTTFALNLTQNIYKPGLSTDIKIAENELLLANEKKREKEISIKQQIAEAYLNVILKEIKWKSTENTTQRNAQYYSLAGEKIKLGVLLENDYLKSKLNYENSKLDELKAKQSYDLAMMQLKHQLNIDEPIQVILTDSIESYQRERVNTDFDNIERTELRQLNLQYTSYQLNLKKGQQYLLPTVSLIANYSTQFQAETFNYNQNVWTPFNYLGMKLSLPVTGNLKNTNTKNEYRIKMTQNALELKQKQQEINKEIVQYRTELGNAENSIAVSENNLELSKKVHQSQLTTYQLGTTTYSSVLDTEGSLITSEQNYIEAVYNYLVAMVNYKKALGEL